MTRTTKITKIWNKPDKIWEKTNLFRDFSNNE